MLSVCSGRGYKRQYKDYCIMIEELLEAGAEDDQLFLPDIPDKCAEVISASSVFILLSSGQIGRDGSYPDCPYDDHCEDWGKGRRHKHAQLTFLTLGPERAAVHFGCLDKLDQLIGQDEQPIEQVSTHQLRNAAKRCFVESNTTEEQRRKK